MASPTPGGIVPLEMAILVSHKIDNTSSNPQIDQVGSVQLPYEIARSARRTYRCIDFPKCGSPMHGFLPIAHQNDSVTFDELLGLFTTAFGETLETNYYTLSGDTVARIYFNYTDKNGERLVSQKLVAHSKKRFGDVFKSAIPTSDATPCTCGCGYAHHGPTIVLVLDGALWDKREGNNFVEASNSYVLTYKDDPQAKIGTSPLSTWIPLVVKQEVSIMTATEERLANYHAKEKALQDTQAAEKEVAKIGGENTTLRAQNDELAEEVARLQGLVGRLHIEQQEMKQVQEDKAALTATKERLTHENDMLKKEIERCDTELNLAISEKRNLSQSSAAISEQCKKAEAENKILKAHRLEMNKRLTSATTTPTATPNYNPGMNARAPRSEGTPNANQTANAFDQNLMSSLRTLAYRDIESSRQTAMIQSKLNAIESHLQNHRPYLVMDAATELLYIMRTSSQPITNLEINSHVNTIMNQAARMTTRPAPTLGPLINTIAANHLRPQNAPTTLLPATAINSTGPTANLEPRTKKRKLDRAPPSTVAQTTQHINTVPATNKPSPGPPRSFV